MNATRSPDEPPPPAQGPYATTPKQGPYAEPTRQPIRYSDLPPRDLPLAAHPIEVTLGPRHPASGGRPPAQEPDAGPDPGRAVERRSRSDRSRSDPGSGDAGSRRRVMPLWQELPLLLIVAFFLAVLIRSFLLQAFFIPSISMEDTLLVGDRVLVNKIVYDVRPPTRGEVVVFRGTDKWAPETRIEEGTGLFDRIGRTFGDLVGVSRPGEKDFIKRVIGLPGDRVSCCDSDGRVYVNGKGLDEPYIYNNSPLNSPPNDGVCGPRLFDEVLVPPGEVFVMGDNRRFSADSRCQGTVPIENLIGRAMAIAWPSGRWTSLKVPDSFDDVPGPVALGLAPGLGTPTTPTALTVPTKPGRLATDDGAVAPGSAQAVAFVPVAASLAAMAGTGEACRRRERTLRT